MADVKCSLGSPIRSGVPATAAEMIMSIRWTGSSAPSSDVIRPWEPKKWRLCSLHQGPEGFLRAASKAVQSFRQGSKGKSDWEPAEGEDEWRLSGLGGVLPEAEGDPNALKVPPPAFGSSQMRITTPPSFSLAEEKRKAQPRLELRYPRWAP